jgi:L-threonylcarbamoyladenylate synthase
MDAVTAVHECTILGAGDAELRRGGAQLRAGLLVAFPTETVYGLGADACNESAALRVFAVKGRPPTDPLIVHVTDPAAAMDRLWAEGAETRALALRLGAVLWPGPLTLVGRASTAVAPSVTGGSGMVGLRVPAHPVARALIDAAGVAVAAPSANTFGHVSPTTARHVYDDLAARDASLLIIDGGRCPVGIESTVVRIGGRGRIEILRRGAVTEHDIQRALGPDAAIVEIVVRNTRANAVELEHAAEAPMMAPGQLLTHYSPTVPAFLVAPRSFPVSQAQTATGTAWRLVGVADVAADINAKTVILDYHGAVAAAFKRCFGVDVRSANGILAYRDLSPAGSPEEASHVVFDALRWTERVTGARVVLLPLIVEFEAASAAGLDTERAALYAAVEDRLFRAASGRVVVVENVVS